MNGWTPIFDIIVDSSLWLEPDYVIKVYLTMLAKKDRWHLVHASAFNIAQWAKKTEAEVLDALKILASPDTKRIEPQEFDGRRIEKQADGSWLILNGEKYRKMVQEVKNRDYRTQWQRDARAKEAKLLGRQPRGHPSPGEAAHTRAIENGSHVPDPGEMQEKRLAERKAKRGGQ